MDTMRRFLVSLTALGLLGVVVGCRCIGDGFDCDCCCDCCETGACGCDAPPPAMGPPPGPATKPASPATPESIKEMPKKLTETSVDKSGIEEAPFRLTPEPQGLDLR